MRHNQTQFEKTTRRQRSRRGIIVILTSFLLTVLFAFMALSVDTGRVVLTETRMQNAVDAYFEALEMHKSARHGALVG